MFWTFYLLLSVSAANEYIGVPKFPSFVIGSYQDSTVSQYFSDVENFLLKQIINVGETARISPYPQCALLSSNNKESCVNSIIIITHFCTNAGYAAYQKVLSAINKDLKYVILNLEVLLDDSFISDKRVSQLQCLNSHIWKQVPVWDYSRLNAHTLQNMAHLSLQRSPQHLLLTYVDGLMTFPIYKTNPPESHGDIDVLFLGHATRGDRRYAIIDSLASRGYRVDVINDAFDNERELLIRSAKVILNIHFYDRVPVPNACKDFDLTGDCSREPVRHNRHTKTSGSSHKYPLETVRLFYTLSVGAFVISEESGDELAQQEYGDMAIFCPYHRIVDAVTTYLPHPSHSSPQDVKRAQSARASVASKAYYGMRALRDRSVIELRGMLDAAIAHYNNTNNS